MALPTSTRLRASVVCRHGDRLLTVAAVDPVSGQRHLFLPGGMIEPNEAPADAAARETQEETGYAVEIWPDSELVLDYDFFWSGRDWSCRTHFFRAILRDQQAGKLARAAHETFLQTVEWVPLADIPNIFAYHDVIRRAVLTLV